MESELGCLGDGLPAALPYAPLPSGDDGDLPSDADSWLLGDDAPGQAPSLRAVKQFVGAARSNARRVVTWPRAVAAVLLLATLGYVAAVVWSGGPYLHHTGPDVVPGLPAHSPRLVWHHAVQRVGRLPLLIAGSACPARDGLGIESDVRLHHGVLTMHHNPFVPLFPPPFIMGTITVVDLVGWIAARSSLLQQRDSRTVLKLDIKTVAAARVLAALPGTHSLAHSITLQSLQTLRGLGVEVWFNADFVPHPSVENFPFATATPALAAAAMRDYDALSVGFRWPSHIDDEQYGNATCAAMLRFTLDAIATLRVESPPAAAAARVTFALRWVQLRSAAAVAAVQSMTRATEAALATATSPGAGRVWVTVWKKSGDPVMADADIRRLERVFPGCSVDCGGRTPLSDNCTAVA